jgi:hypothetical protein
MKPSRRLLHVILALALLLAGFPVHALANGPIDPVVAAEQSVEPTSGGCPLHAAKQSKTPAPVETADDPFQCCGSDCRCSCAGLTVMALVSLTDQAMMPFHDHIPARFTLLTSISPTALLKPPQS